MRLRVSRPLATAFLLLLISSLLPGAAASAGSAGADPARVAGSTGRGPADPAEFEAFVRGIIEGQLETYHIPGAVLVAVKDGEVFAARGYGYSDLERKTPVTPDRTLFNVGSVTKLFTATAVLQLAEQGRLDLQADVNDYLEAFKVPATYPEPITAASLLTHTSGLGEKVLGMTARSLAEQRPLDEFLADDLPPRVRPVGDAVQYSNHGYSLLACLVEAISGVPFEEYVQRNIFDPLGMARATFGLPADLAPDMAVAYSYQGGRYLAQPPLPLNVRGAGDLKVTGLDLARFLIAQLQNGRYGDARILEERTALDMHARHYEASPELAGYCYGFYEDPRNGERIIAHGGDVPIEGTSSHVWLIPEHNFGLFVAYSSSSGMARDELLTAIMNRYFPPERPVAEEGGIAGAGGEAVALGGESPSGPGGDGEPGPEGAADLRCFTGTYRSLREDHFTFLDLPLVLTGNTPEVVVTAAGDGTLVITPVSGLPGPAVLEPATGAGPGVFLIAGDPNLKVVFQGHGGSVPGRTAGDRARRMIYVSPLLTLERVPWYATFRFQMAALGLILLALLSGLVAWTAAGLRERNRRLAAGQPWLSGEVRPDRVTSSVARAVGLTMASTVLVFVVGFGLILSSLGARIIIGVPPALKILFALPALGAALALAMIVLTVLLWREKRWSLPARLHYTLVTLAAVGFMAFAEGWNLLGFHF